MVRARSLDRTGLREFTPPQTSWLGSTQFVCASAERSVSDLLRRAAAQGTQWLVLLGPRYYPGGWRMSYHLVATDELESRVLLADERTQSARRVLRLVAREGAVVVAEGQPVPEAAWHGRTSAVVVVDVAGRVKQVGFVARESLALRAPVRHAQREAVAIAPERRMPAGRQAASPIAPTTALGGRNHLARRTVRVEIAAPADALPGKPFDVVVRVQYAGIAARSSRPPDPLALTLTLSTRRDDIQGELLTPTEIRLCPAQPTHEHTFKLRARFTAPLSVSVKLWYLGVGVAVTQVELRIAPGASGTQTVRSSATAVVPKVIEPRGPTLLVQAIRIEQGLALRFVLLFSDGDRHQAFQSDLSPDGGTRTMSSAEDLRGRMEQRLRDSLGEHDGMPKMEAFRELGAEWALTLLGRPLLSALWKCRAALDGICVDTWLDGVPWELLLVHAPDHATRDARFLGEYGLTRGTPWRALPEWLPGRDWMITGGEFQDDVHSRLQARVSPPGKAAGRRGLRLAAEPAIIWDALHRCQFDVMQVHARPGLPAAESGPAALVVGEEYRGSLLHEVALTSPELLCEADLARRGPVVFLSVCSQGRFLPCVPRLTGWAAALLEAGAGLVIVPRWPVDEELSQQFAHRFLAAILDGRRVWEAAALARRCALESDPNALAFEIHGQATGRMRAVRSNPFGSRRGPLASTSTSVSTS